MAKNHAQQYPAVLNDPAIVAISGKAAAGRLTFASLTAPSPPRLAPPVSAAIEAIAKHVNTGTMTVSISQSRTSSASLGRRSPFSIATSVVRATPSRSATSACVSRARLRASASRSPRLLR
jgi:hypothetical protein